MVTHILHQNTDDVNEDAAAAAILVGRETDSSHGDKGDARVTTRDVARYTCLAPRLVALPARLVSTEGPFSILGKCICII